MVRFLRQATGEHQFRPLLQAGHALESVPILLLCYVEQIL